MVVAKNEFNLARGLELKSLSSWERLLVMFRVHSISGLSQTKWRMEFAPVQTEPRSTIKPGPGLLLIYGSAIVKSLSGEGKSQCHCWDTWKPGEVLGCKFTPSPPASHGNVRGDRCPDLRLLAEGGALWWGWRNSLGTTLREKARSGRGEKWLRTKKEKSSWDQYYRKVCRGVTGRIWGGLFGSEDYRYRMLIFSLL